MKILEIRFKNLNSLEGEWCIDFTHTIYQQNSIFAITGPTGSGKTTLLDAICLALYGQTPRLKIISKSVNELLTRQTGECYAEVIFETMKGCFRCHWSQHRARKSPQGELQQPRHEIVDHNSNKVLESKIKNVAKIVEEVTGMNFNQFTRSILLAQGRFADFLQATPDERAPLLEQLTGTEIYGLISRKVHERTALQEKEYAAMAEQIGSLVILSVEEKEELEKQLTSHKEKIETLATAITALQKAMTWQTNIATLQTETTALEQKLAKQQSIIEQEALCRASLHKAKTASTLVHQHENLLQYSALQKEEYDEVTSLKKERQRLLSKLEELESCIKRDSAALQKATESLDKEKDLIKIVRTLDVRIEEMQNQLAKLTLAGNQLLQKKNETAARCQELKAILAQKKSEVERYKSYLIDNKIDAELTMKLGTIQENIEALSTTLGKRQKTSDHLAENKILQRKASERYYAAEKNHLRSRKAYIDAGKVFKKAQKKRAELRRNHPDLRLQLDKLAEDLLHLEKLGANIEKKNEITADIVQFAKEKETFIKNLNSYRKDEQHLHEKISTQQQIVAQLEEIALLASRVKNYEKERESLSAGSPCPLCGATEHPFAAGDVPGEDSTRKKLEKETAHLVTFNKKLNDLHTAATLSQAKIKENEKRVKILTQQLDDFSTKIAQLQETSKLDSKALTIENVAAAKSSIMAQRNCLRKIAEELEHQEEELAVLQETVDNCRKEETEQERRVNLEMFEVKRLAEKEVELSLQTQTLEEEIYTLKHKLHSALVPYGYSEIKESEIHTIQKKLENRQQKWQEFSQLVEKLDEQSNRIEGEHDKEQVLFHKFGEDHVKLQQETAVLQKSYTTSLSERSKLYGNKSPDTEEARLTDIVTQKTERLRELDTSLNSTREAVALCRDRVHRLEKSTSSREDVLQKEQQTFEIALRHNGFTNKENFLEALLPEEKVAELESFFHDLDRETSRISSLLEDKQAALQVEKHKKITFREFEDLEKEIQQKNHEQQTLLQETGKLQAKLEENERLIRQQHERQKQLSAHQRELVRWQKLDHLIGSANGKKFRNFAQGITFEIMVGQANRSLQKMTDRYILIRDNTHPLELNIIDNYRAGDIRSTKNLSGGESFLVSLALALGLSRMAGNNVRVDSLFLDEGFGTLDEETLDTALQTLAGLQQEGKMIGIISHISMLQERLDTRIEVIPGRGGHSTLKGPGISSS